MERERSQIVKSILEAAKKEDRQEAEEIAESIDLKEDVTKEYLSTLTKRGLLKEHHSKSSYDLTSKGRSLLNAFEKLKDISTFSIIF